jgi:hypothetical protein
LSHRPRVGLATVHLLQSVSGSQATTEASVTRAGPAWAACTGFAATPLSMRAIDTPSSPPGGPSVGGGGGAGVRSRDRRAGIAPGRPRSPRAGRGANVNDGHGRAGRIAEATHLETSRHALTV